MKHFDECKDVICVNEMMNANTGYCCTISSLMPPVSSYNATCLQPSANYGREYGSVLWISAVRLISDE